MDVEGVLQAGTTILTPLAAVVGLLSRKRRWRNEIRENLSLVQELDKDEVLREQTPASMLLRGKILLDVAKFSGQPLGTPKKPVSKGAVAFAAVLVIGFSYWTYYINRDGFAWYSIFPGTAAFLF